MHEPRYPSLYQINTRVWLTELSGTLGRSAILDDIPDAQLDRVAELGVDWIWLLSVWQTGPGGQRVSRNHPEWRREFQETLPDLREEDIAGSGFAITGYTVHANLGGDAALARLRERLRDRGLKLMVDFVPNHVGPDHPWVEAHPDYFVHGTERDLAEAPYNYTRVQRPAGDWILAHGRDPYFPGWPDTLQLDYANPSLQEAMIGELVKIAGQCDGVRCDMAMLVLPDVFERTWGQRAPLFWPTATGRVRARVPDFLFMAEVYWDLEWTLQQQGFNYAYDKRLYDRLRDGRARPVREHFHAGLDYQDRLARFLENHDEPRAAATFSLEVHQAAAAITFLSPGLRFFHQGQFEGRMKRISPHLARGPQEPDDETLLRFYARLLELLRRPVLRDGQWQLLECSPAWDGNRTHECFLVFAWHGPQEDLLVVAVNYALNPSQCHVRLPFPGLAGEQWQLQDQLGSNNDTRSWTRRTPRPSRLFRVSRGISLFRLRSRRCVLADGRLGVGDRRALAGFSRPGVARSAPNAFANSDVDLVRREPVAGACGLQPAGDLRISVFAQKASAPSAGPAPAKTEIRKPGPGWRKIPKSVALSLYRDSLLGNDSLDRSVCPTPHHAGGNRLAGTASIAVQISI